MFLALPSDETAARETGSSPRPLSRGKEPLTPRALLGIHRAPSTEYRPWEAFRSWCGVSEMGTQVRRPDGLLGYFPKVGHTGKWGLASSSLDPGGVPSPLHQSAFQWRDRVYSQGSTRPSWATLCDTSPRSHVFLTDVFLCVFSQVCSLRAELTAGKDSP